MQKQRSTLSTVTVAVAALGLLTACGSEKAGSQTVGGAPDPSSVTDHEWQVESVTADGKTSKAASGSAHVSFKDGRASGNLGCNGFGGEAAVEGGSLKVGKLMRTQMACEKELMGFENRAIEALADGKLKIGIDGDSLTLTAANGDRISLTAKEPTPLTGTKWKIGALTEGKSASSLPKGVEAHLTFGKDGTVSGSLGCNSVNAKATVRKDGKIDLGPARATRKLCPEDKMKTERALLALFDGRVVYEQQGDRLTLTAASGDKGFTATPAEPDPDATSDSDSTSAPDAPAG